MFLYKYYPCKKYSFNNLAKEQVTFNTLINYLDDDKNEGNLNVVSKKQDDMKNECEKRLSEALVKRTQEMINDTIYGFVRVLCLTDSCDYKYMWENYANDGKGFCVEYEYNNINKISNSLNNINYISSADESIYFEDTLSIQQFNEIINKILFNKDEIFVKEREYRAIIKIPIHCKKYVTEVSPQEFCDYRNNNFQKNQDYYYYFDIFHKKDFKIQNLVNLQCKINRVYIGYDVLPDDEEKIMEICNKKNYKFSFINKKILKNV